MEGGVEEDVEHISVCAVAVEHCLVCGGEAVEDWSISTGGVKVEDVVEFGRVSAPC